ncbi:hypothetical protein [Kocuria sp.]|uniref:hypothetical protein n=1 Tax=Kocuria sp. TaxID=1871328 RepID=UPI0026DEDC04|nr:hypothetical protein [Kocuria sp.]MDO5617651.1 hypothetical protein [Kocuria sp.]
MPQTPRFAQPTVLRAADWPSSTHAMTRDPHMVQLAHGLWARFDSPMQRSDLADWEIAALAQPMFGPGSAVAGISAAQMFGIPLMAGMHWLDDVLRESSAARPTPQLPQLAVPESTRNRGRTELSLRRRRRALYDQEGSWDSCVTGGLETLLMLQEWLVGWRSVVAVDHVLSNVVDQFGRPAPLLPETLDRHMAKIPNGARGKARLHLAVERSRPGVRSPMETVLRLFALSCGVEEPIHDYRIVLRNGRLVYLDLAWPHRKKALEYNGEIHQRNWRQYRDEMGRFTDLRDDGWDVRFVVVDDLRDTTRLAALERWLLRP